METKQGIIKSVEVSKGFSEKGDWTKYLFKMQDGKSYSTFDAVIGKAFGAGDTVEFTGEQSGKYWNLQSMRKIENTEVIKPQNFGKEDRTTSMYVSYVKDLIIAGNKLEESINMIKQAIEAFS